MNIANKRICFIVSSIVLLLSIYVLHSFYSIYIIDKSLVTSEYTEGVLTQLDDPLFLAGTFRDVRIGDYILTAQRQEELSKSDCAELLIKNEVTYLYLISYYNSLGLDLSLLERTTEQRLGNSLESAVEHFNTPRLSTAIDIIVRYYINEGYRFNSTEDALNMLQSELYKYKLSCDINNRYDEQGLKY